MGVEVRKVVWPPGQGRRPQCHAELGGLAEPGLALKLPSGYAMLSESRAGAE